MRILFVTSTRIGDAVLSTGLLAHLIERYPGARITLACGPDAAPLFDAAPNIERRITMTKRKWGLHWFDLWRRCMRVWWGWGQFAVGPRPSTGPSSGTSRAASASCSGAVHTRGAGGSRRRSALASPYRR